MFFIYFLLISTRIHIYGDVLISDHGLSTSQCTDYKMELAKLASNVTFCFVQFSQPLRICMECHHAMKIFNNTYKDLLRNDNCSNQLIYSDISSMIQVVWTKYNFEWMIINCDKCYFNKTHTLAPEFSNFLQLEDDVLNCMASFTDADLKYRDPKFEADWRDKRFNKTSCTKCIDQYEKVNELYNQLEKNMDKNDISKLWRGLCGDMGEIMNMTRYLWSKQFKCYRYDIEWWWAIGPICVVVAMLLIFYCIVSTYFHNKIDMIMYRQRRLRPIVYEMDSKLQNSVN